MQDLLLNNIVISVVSAIVVCHIWKFIDLSSRSGKLEWYGWVATGGMPSSHSSFVSALATGIGIVDGFTSSVFLLSAGFAMIVIRDAFGVRRDVDQIKNTLNEIVKQKKLGVKEILRLTGHTPVQVVVGCIIGVAIPVIVHLIRIKMAW